MRPLFKHDRVSRLAEHFLDGLLGEERRKTGWMRAEAAGDPGPWRQQAILGRAQWDADALRDIVRDYALETLADNDAILVVDETGFLKQGKASCGVARQYTGSAGKITNCQIGVFVCYVAERGHAFIDRELYLPKSWTDDKARMAKAHVPRELIDSAHGGFATKPALALAMIERAIGANVPFSFVAADTVYGAAISKWRSGAPVKVMCSALSPTSRFIPGTSRSASERRWKSPTVCRLPLGDGCRQALARRASACTIGLISNSPILTPRLQRGV